MAVRLRVKEVAKEKGFSMGKLQRDADVEYNTVKRMYKNPYHGITKETLLKLLSANSRIQLSKLHMQRLYSDKQACVLLLQNQDQLFTRNYRILLDDSSLEELAKDFARQNLPFSDRFYKCSVIWEGLRNEARYSMCWNNP